MKKILIAAISIFLFSIPLVSNATITFERTYTGRIGNFVQQTTDGGYVITGLTGYMYDAIPLIKTDSLGDTLWTKSFPNPDIHFSSINGECVRQTADSGYIILGKLSSASMYNCGLIIKTNSMGDFLWESDHDFFYVYSIQQTADNGYIIAGDFSSPTLLKVDSLGTTVWEKTFYNPDLQKGWIYCSAVQKLPDKGYIACFSAYNSSVFLLKTDSLGDSLWTKKIVDSARIYDFQRTTDNGYVLISIEDIGTNNMDICLLKTDSLGDTLWTKTYGGSKWDIASAVRQTTDGGYVITGYISEDSVGYIYSSKGIWLIKTDSLGDTLWTKVFGGTGWEAACCVEQTADGGYIITGYKNGGDIYLIKTDSFGNVGIEEEQVSDNRQKAILEIRKDKIYLSVSNAINVDVKIYDLTSRLQNTVYQGTLSKGNYTFTPNIHKSGIYFVRLKTNNVTETKKLILMK